MTQKTILWMCVFLLSTSLIYSEDSWSATNKNYEERINKLEKQLKKLARKSTKRNRAINSKFKKAQARLKFNGFVSAGLSRSDEAADSIIGVSDQNNYLVDTIFGLQVNAKINDKTSAVLQLVGRGIDANNVLAEWGYLSHAFTPNVTVRIGRLRVPFYVASEYIEVGYAYPWVRPPIDVYTLVPITSYYGTDITM
ncbi:MAG: hypothetical protein JKY67_18695 [Pseudomonadales bacterium]|nr:hypothetical protein [Pseudomonadales bacterium]